MTTGEAVSETPISTINTTPLIDVMLVLLIMFVITIPVATNSVPIDLPSGLTTQVVQPLQNTVSLDANGTIRWNGEAVESADLAKLLYSTTRMPTEPQLRFRPDAGASYDRAAQVLAAIKASGVTNFGFVDNDRFGHFEQ
ncbi:biopolymer transporter ExbD [Novosphingobium sp. KA1]|uniref:ExbD/TolR family protein n=1 Tax=Novosphingobium sp. (strain KA1) TaxID=164608 RepID=UPI002104137A|nr:biopolymer transporter ExbD [Novosphingobium sp. KA1]